MHQEVRCLQKNNTLKTQPYTATVSYNYIISKPLLSPRKIPSLIVPLRLTSKTHLVRRKGNWGCHSSLGVNKMDRERCKEVCKETNDLMQYTYCKYIYVCDIYIYINLLTNAGMFTGKPKYTLYTHFGENTWLDKVELGRTMPNVQLPSSHRSQ